MEIHSEGMSSITWTDIEERILKAHNNAEPVEVILKEWITELRTAIDLLDKAAMSNAQELTNHIRMG